MLRVDSSPSTAILFLLVWSGPLVALSLLGGCAPEPPAARPAVVAAAEPQGSFPAGVLMRVDERTLVPGRKAAAEVVVRAWADVEEVALLVTTGPEVALPGDSAVQTVFERAIGAVQAGDSLVFRVDVPVQLGLQRFRAGLTGRAAEEGAVSEGVAASLYALAYDDESYVSPYSSMHARLDSVKAARGMLGRFLPGMEKPGLVEETIETEVIRGGESDSSQSSRMGTVVVEGLVLWTASNGTTHPVRNAVVEVIDEDVALDDVVRVRTNAAGRYRATLDAGPLDSPDVRVRVRAESEGFIVEGPGFFDGVYTVQSTLVADVTSDVIAINLVARTGTVSERAFSVVAALEMAQRYMGRLGASAPGQLRVEFPNGANSSYYCGDTLFDLEGSFSSNCLFRGHLSLQGTDQYDWDVIHHEYGHYVQDVYNITDSPGGCHPLTNLSEPYTCRGNRYDRGKSQGTRLAWGEGWPTYFGTVLQREMGGAALGIPNVGDTRYTETDESTLDYGIETKSGAGSTAAGEDNEAVVTRVLYDLYDSNRDAGDEVAYGDQALWGAVTGARPTRLSAFYTAFVDRVGGAPGEASEIGRVFAEHGVAPDPTAPADGATLAFDGSVKLDWDEQGGGPSYRNDEFVIEYLDTSLQNVLGRSETLSAPPHAPTVDEIEAACTGPDGWRDAVAWRVLGAATAEVRTPAGDRYYVSETREADCPPSKAVAYVIDRSGSMGGSPLTNAKSAAVRGAISTALGDELAMVAFSSGASVPFRLRRMGDSIDRFAAAGSISGISATGSTSIGSGLQAAYYELRRSQSDDRSYVLLSDGEENRAPYARDVLPLFQSLQREGTPPLASAGGGPKGPGEAGGSVARSGVRHRIYTVAYGTASDEQLMAEIASATGGRFFYAPDRNDPVALARVFEAIQSEIDGTERLAERSGTAGVTGAHAFLVGSDAASITVKALWDPAYGALTLAVADAAGQPVLAPQTTGPGIAYVTLSAPAPGTWSAEVTGPAAPYALVVSATSTVGLRVALGDGPFDTRSTVPVRAVLTDGGLPLTGATVRAVVTPPSALARAFQKAARDAEAAGTVWEEGGRSALLDALPKPEASAARAGHGAAARAGVADTLVLYDDGAHNDGAAGDGVYGAGYRPGGSGSYTVTVTATGQASSGPFAREGFAAFFVDLASGNAPPTADAGADRVAECSAADGTPVLLDGSASFDPDGDALRFTWSVDGAVVAGPSLDPTAVVPLALGTHAVTLLVEDDRGGSADTTIAVTVEDTTAPTLSVGAAPLEVWPPNHQMVSVALDGLGLTATDACDAAVSATRAVVVAVTSDEADDGDGDGSTTGDVAVPACRVAAVRAERAGGGNGRVYTLRLGLADAAGNVGEATYEVAVPKSKGHPAVADAFVGASAEGCDPAAEPGSARPDALAREDQAPATFAVDAPFPNPTSGAFHLRARLDVPTAVGVDVVDALGRRVLARPAEQHPAGPWAFSADGLSAGVYLVRARFDPEGRAPLVRTFKVIVTR